MSPAIFVVLISNGIKLTHKYDITLNANKGNKESKNVSTLHLRVSDIGVGIAAAELLIL
ncbi:hypothetical protein [Trichormus azollae]|uniref:hypothetical protein n=1 Tax=Trichormus azollae TaxID=1164 RepID=UPI00325F9346